MANEVQLRSKEKKFKGQNLEDLKKLDVRESAKFLPSRSRRSILRNFDVVEKFVKSCERKMQKNKKIKTHNRDLVIVPRMVGMNIGIHNGKAFQNVEITIEMIGHRLGEFAQTRTRVAHSGAGVGATKGSKSKKK